MKSSGLGRGLDSLIPRNFSDKPAPEAGTIDRLPLSVIDIAPNQPRKKFDPELLEELSHSIKTHGIVQPVLVRRQGERFLLIAGERRLRAARMAELGEIPVRVWSGEAGKDFMVALIENLQRNDLTPLECAAAYQTLMEEHDLTQEQLAGLVHKSRSAIANTLRLLSLSEPVKEALQNEQISEGHARLLLPLDRETQLRVLSQVIAQNWSVHELAARLKQRENTPAKRPEAVSDPAIRPLEDYLAQTLAAKVAIRPQKNGGSIQIQYKNSEDLERLLSVLTQK